MAPHVNLWLASRGMNIGLSARIYFPDEEELNAQDPVSRIVGAPARQRTLITRREERNDLLTYVFDIHLQGEHETVFFDL